MWSARRCARSARRQSAPRRRFPSATAAPPPPRLAENLRHRPSPAARPAPISLRSSGPLARFRLKSCNSTLADWPDGHLNSTAACTADPPKTPPPAWTLTTLQIRPVLTLIFEEADAEFD